MNYEKRELNNSLIREIVSIWESDELRRYLFLHSTNASPRSIKQYYTHSPHRTKPTPIDEAKAGLAVVENVLWNAVPGYLRKLNDVSNQQLGIAFRCR